MSQPEQDGPLEQRIGEWRNYLRRRQAIHTVDVAELEDHLREQIAALTERGLTGDEAFLVAVKRMGDLDTLSREFAREHSERLWKHLVDAGTEESAERGGARRDAMAAIGLAVAAAVAVKLPAVFGLDLDRNAGFYLRNATLFVLPFLTMYFVLKRRPATATLGGLAAAFVAVVLVANLMPVAPGGATEVLMALHLPIALWLVVGVAYAGGRWSESAGRMDFIRFSGELFIYYVLIALGGGVLTGFVVMIFESIGVDVEVMIGTWLIPCGAAGAVLIASWLVEAKQSVIENMAPVLTRLFTPLFAVVLLTFLGALAWTGRGINIEREMLIAFDLLLVVVVALVLYSMSARDPVVPPRPFDVVSVVLVLSALLVDMVALGAIAQRITSFGFTPNRVAALGMNVILLTNLVGTAVLYTRFLRGRGGFAPLERWQTRYLPVYAVWAAIVVIVFPPLFGYL
jgi:hypothetical protein